VFDNVESRRKIIMIHMGKRGDYRAGLKKRKRPLGDCQVYLNRKRLKVEGEREKGRKCFISCLIREGPTHPGTPGLNI